MWCWKDAITCVGGMWRLVCDNVIIFVCVAFGSGAVELAALRTEREALGTDVDSDVEADLSSREAKAKEKMAAVSLGKGYCSFSTCLTEKNGEGERDECDVGRMQSHVWGACGGSSVIM